MPKIHLLYPIMLQIKVINIQISQKNHQNENIVHFKAFMTKTKILLKLPLCTVVFTNPGF